LKDLIIVGRGGRTKMRRMGRQHVEARGLVDWRHMRARVVGRRSGSCRDIGRWRGRDGERRGRRRKKIMRRKGARRRRQGDGGGGRAMATGSSGRRGGDDTRQGRAVKSSWHTWR
jgi:hypothetical protein